MAGNTEYVDFWSEADVFLDFTRTAPGPTDLEAEWDDLWGLVGLLNGDDGMTEGRDENAEDHYAWGGILIGSTYSQHKRTLSLVALEDNLVTFGLINPGSTRTASGGVIHSEIYVPKRKKLRAGFEWRGDDAKKRRFAHTAKLGEVAEIETNESAPPMYNVTLDIYPDGNGKLWDDYRTDPDYVAPPPGG